MLALSPREQGLFGQDAALHSRRNRPAVGRVLRVGVLGRNSEVAPPRGAGKAIRRAGSHGSVLQSEFHTDSPRQILAQRRPLRAKASEVAQESHHAMGNADRVLVGLHSPNTQPSGDGMDTQQLGTVLPKQGAAVPRRKRKSVRQILEEGFPRQLRRVCDGYGKKKAAAAAAERGDRTVGNWLNGVRKPCFTDVIMLARKFGHIKTWLHAMVHAKEADLERLNAELVAMDGQLAQAERRFAASLALAPGEKPTFRRTAIAALKNAGHAVRHPVLTFRRRRAHAGEVV